MAFPLSCPLPDVLSLLMKQVSRTPECGQREGSIAASIPAASKHRVGHSYRVLLRVCPYQCQCGRRGGPLKRPCWRLTGREGLEIIEQKGVGRIEKAELEGMLLEE